MTIDVHNVIEFIKKVKSGYAVQCVTTGFTKNVSMSEDYFMYISELSPDVPMYFRSNRTFLNSKNIFT